jgi:hypothetical protein
MPISKWNKRFKKTFGKIIKIELESNYRYPPKPINYYTDQTGKCRWCGEMIVDDEGTIIHDRHWHPKCLDKYMFIYHATETRKVVFKRDNGECNWCGKKSSKWHADHINPLVEQKGISIEELDYSYWELTNLQTLCASCHYEKSGKESTNRATVRKNKDKIRWKSFREIFGG